MPYDRSRIHRLALVASLLVALTSCSDGSKSVSRPAPPAPVAQDESGARAVLAAAPLGHPLSFDAHGAARFVAGAVGVGALPLALSAESAARAHLSLHAAMLGLNQDVVASASIVGSHPLAGGASIVQFAQRANGVEVFGARASVVVDGSRRLVSIGNSLVAASSAAVGKSGAFPLSAEWAVAHAYSAQFGVALAGTAVRETGARGKDMRTYSVVPPGGAPRVLDATAKRVFYPQPNQLVPAYYVEILARSDGSNENQAGAYVIGESDGNVFYRTSLTENDAFTYRVWASATGNHIPADGPMVDSTPHPSGRADGVRPAFAAPILVSMEGFNKNTQGSADPWLAATDTATFGNNVRAYSDRGDSVDDAGTHHNDGYDEGVDIRADVTAPKTFDRIFDVTKAPDVSTDQIKAAVTQIFYVTNWLHDYWYDSGFDEASGVAQLSNFGRGGVEGDPLRAEAQDEASSGTANNANMSTMSDGTSPRMQMYVWSGAPLRDGTIDNTVVAHEWGHYLHHRLVLCGSPSCRGMSEGWADFDAIMMVIKDGDVFDGKVYPLAQYATSGIIPNAAYFGIRRAPYSTDMTKNAFTFRHVRKAATLPASTPLSPASPDMSEIHNVGEIWASALFEGYVNLINAGKAATPPRSFDESKRRMADYVVAGMKATPVEPTFVEQRDALLSTVLATGRKDDFTALAQGFAKRGLGVGAVAPPTSSTTLNEAVENFDFKGNLAFVDAKVDDSVRSCDRDGNLDASEAGKLTIRLRNGGWLSLSKTQVKASTTDSNLIFENGGVASVAALDPYGIATVVIGVSARPSASAHSLVPITITLSDVDSFKPTFDTPFQTLFNFDEKALSSAKDDVESEHTVWTAVRSPRPLPVAAWSRKGDAANHVWHGDDLGAVSDESLVSPSLVVSTSSPFGISFSHRYSFELGPTTPGGAPDAYFDGGVLEISDDGGTTWKDVSTYVNPNYPRTLYASSSPAMPDTNPLAGRKAWGGQSAGYPNKSTVTLNLGTQLADKTVKVRFRIGTDEGTGDAGWDVDDLAFTGISNMPFSSVVDNATPACPDAGVPNPPDGGSTGSSGSSSTTAGAGGSSSDAGNAGGGGAPAGGTGGAAGLGMPPVTGGGPGAVAKDGGSASTDGGCSCSIFGARPGRSGAALLALVGALTLVRRRRPSAATSAAPPRWRTRARSRER